MVTDKLDIIINALLDEKPRIEVTPRRRIVMSNDAARFGTLAVMVTGLKAALCRDAYFDPARTNYIHLIPQRYF